MIAVAWDFVQGLGALVGLASGAYLLLDRITKGDPTIAIVAAPLGGVGRRSAYLRITNRSERPILLHSTNGARLGQFGIVENHTTAAIVAANLDPASSFAIDGLTTVDFPMLMPPDLEQLPPDEHIRLNARWTSAQGTWWPFPRFLRLSITKRALRALLKRQDDELV